MLGCRQLVLAAVLVAALGVATARVPRNAKEAHQDEERLRRQRESGIHTYYVLVKPGPDGQKNSKARTEELAAAFHSRLGGDEHVTVVAASKDKIVMKIKGDDAFAREIVSATQSFPETALLEKKPIYRTLDARTRRGAYRGGEKPEAATM